MAVRVEFYGIARQRAEVSQLALDMSQPEITFGGALARIASLVPAFARDCLADDRLQSTLTANIDGQRFVSDPATPIFDGQCLLILSADAGG
jgi:sulfur-carrier protein